MDRFEIWKKILPGLIPIFVFIIVDEVWGTVPGLIFAVLAGSIELIRSWIKDRKIDRFVLFDTVLLVALGGVSILLRNEIFFKIKPALIQVILLAIIGLAAFSPADLTGMMTKRYMKGWEVSEAQSKAMRKSMKMVFWVILAHTALVFYATFYMSKQAWAFISGGLLYILFGVIFLVQFISARVRKRKLSQEEWVPLVNERGDIVGKAPRSEVHKGNKMLHPVVHIHFISLTGKLLLQKRANHKLVQPGKWDTAVGGHILVGESLETALQREAAEETGLSGFTAKLVKIYHWETEIEAELVYMFAARTGAKPETQSDEVEELKFWSKSEIQKQLGNHVFTPNFEYDYNILISEKLL